MEKNWNLVKDFGDYQIVEINDRYLVYDGKEMLVTPGGKLVTTMYLPVAERLVEDLQTMGYDSYTDACSVLAYHFTMIELLLPLKKEEVIYNLNDTNWQNNWTFRCPTANPHIWMEWVYYFGQGEKKIEFIQQWMQNCTVMQLCAIMCIFNQTYSMNVAYYFAMVVELVAEEEHEENITNFYNFYSKFSRDFYPEEFMKMFECFKLYYGIHFKEEGAHLPQVE